MIRNYLIHCLNPEKTDFRNKSLNTLISLFYSSKFLTMKREAGAIRCLHCSGQKRDFNICPEVHCWRRSCWELWAFLVFCLIFQNTIPFVLLKSEIKGFNSLLVRPINTQKKLFSRIDCSIVKE